MGWFLIALTFFHFSIYFCHSFYHSFSDSLTLLFIHSPHFSHYFPIFLLLYHLFNPLSFFRLLLCPTLPLILFLSCHLFVILSLSSLHLLVCSFLTVSSFTLTFILKLHFRFLSFSFDDPFFNSPPSLHNLLSSVILLLSSLFSLLFFLFFLFCHSFSLTPLCPLLSLYHHILHHYLLLPLSLYLPVLPSPSLDCSSARTIPREDNRYLIPIG